MDSPPPSFIPLTLSDTLQQPKRTLNRTTNIARPPGSAAGARPSHAHSQSLSSLQAKQAAAAMCESLGIPCSATATAASSGTSEEEGEEELDDEVGSTSTPRPKPSKGTSASTSSSAAAAGEEQERAKLRRQVASLQKEKGDLLARAERAEAKLRAGAGAGVGGAGGAGVLDAKQLEELERSFADQERLLGGFQAQSEKDSAAIETLKRQQRRLTDFLGKTFGATWESDLFSSPLSSAIAASTASPALRHKLGGRQSLLHSTPTIRRRVSDSLEETPLAAEGEAAAEVVGGQAGSLLTPEALRAHLDAVQRLVRGWEARLVEREGELAEMERRAREEARVAEEKSQRLEEMVRELREERA